MEASTYMGGVFRGKEVKPELSITEIIRNNFHRIRISEWEWLLNVCGWPPGEAANMVYCLACLEYGEDW